MVTNRGGNSCHPNELMIIISRRAKRRSAASVKWAFGRSQSWAQFRDVNRHPRVVPFLLMIKKASNRSGFKLKVLIPIMMNFWGSFFSGSNNYLQGSVPVCHKKREINKFKMLFACQVLLCGIFVVNIFKGRLKCSPIKIFTTLRCYLVMAKIIFRE